MTISDSPYTPPVCKGERSPQIESFVRDLYAPPGDSRSITFTAGRLTPVNEPDAIVCTPIDLKVRNDKFAGFGVLPIKLDQFGERIEPQASQPQQKERGPEQ